MRKDDLDVVGTWTQVKLAILREYAAAYTAILSKQPSIKSYAYIDAFAGAGRHIAKETGDEIAGSLRERLDEAIEGTGIEILRVKNNRVLERAMSGMDVDETLDDLDATDVFKRCLESHEIPEDQRPALLSAYREIIVSLNEQDQMAE